MVDEAQQSPPEAALRYRCVSRYAPKTSEFSNIVPVGENSEVSVMAVRLFTARVE